jgi:hypothetical protein
MWLKLTVEAVEYHLSTENISLIEPVDGGYDLYYAVDFGPGRRTLRLSEEQAAGLIAYLGGPAPNGRPEAARFIRLAEGGRARYVPSNRIDYVEDMEDGTYEVNFTPAPADHRTVRLTGDEAKDLLAHIDANLFRPKGGRA